jgi:AcrR family transcriptional regulator
MTRRGGRPRGRPRETEKKRELEARVLDYAIAHGLSDLTLRPLARALGTSARMLVYHFGSREGLMHTVVRRLREREDAQIEQWWKFGARSLPEFIRWYWRRLSQPRARPLARLVFEVYSMALRDPRQFPGVLDEPVAYWRRLTRRSGARRSAADAQATFALAATRGLLLDLVASGNRPRIQRAVEILAFSFEHAAMAARY